MAYAHVESGSVIALYETVPQSFKNVSNFHVLSESARRDHGLYPVVETNPPAPGQQVTDTVFTVDESTKTVTATHTLITPVPETITATQVRLWLVRNGINLAQVSSALAAIEDAQQRAEAEVYWEYAPYIERSNPLVAAIGAALNLDNAALDAAFIAASSM